MAFECIGVFFGKTFWGIENAEGIPEQVVVRLQIDRVYEAILGLVDNNLGVLLIVYVDNCVVGIESWVLEEIDQRQVVPVQAAVGFQLANYTIAPNYLKVKK
jgi:hypothetical protein